MIRYLTAGFLLLTFCQVVGQPLRNTVTYKIHETGREERVVSADKGPDFGIDINSSVQIDFNRDLLRQQLGSGSVADARLDLGQRFTHVAEAVSAARDAVLAAETSYKKMQQDPANEQLFRAKARDMGTKMLAILNALEPARAARLGEPRAKADMEALFMKLPYDWDLLTSMLQEELDALYADLDAKMEQEQISVEVFAARLGKGKEAVPVYLPNYNEVVTGPADFFRKVRYEVPADVLAEYEQSKTLARELEKTKDLAGVVEQMLELEYIRIKARLVTLTRDLAAAVDEAKVQIEVLKSWNDKAKLEAWLASVKDRLEETQDGREAKRLWEKLAGGYDQIVADLEAMEGLADLKDSLNGKTPEQAMTAILNATKSVSTAIDRLTDKKTWEGYKNDLDAFKAAVVELDESLKKIIMETDGPAKALLDTRDVLVKVGNTTLADGAEIAAFFQSLVGHREVLAIGDLQAPGQKSRPVTGDLNTNFDVKTIKEGRGAGDQIHVRYRLRKGDELIKEWTDIFYIRLYGFSDQYVAGVAFTHRSGEDWEPTANLSWILDYRRWPKKDQPGGPGANFRLFSGYGLSTMSLNHVEEESVELGVAPTLSFLNHRLLAGYGWNLQANENKTFAFISLRFLGRSGPITNQ